MDDADLALIEMNSPTPLVERLVHEIRRLQDEILDRDMRIDDLECELRHRNEDDQ